MRAEVEDYVDGKLANFEVVLPRRSPRWRRAAAPADGGCATARTTSCADALSDARAMSTPAAPSATLVDGLLRP
jgi:hypothetical protein